MVSKKMIIRINEGLHLRPITELCNCSIQFKSNIMLHTNHKTVNAKSVLGVLSACVKFGDEIEIMCEGEDEEEALSSLTSLIENNFN